MDTNRIQPTSINIEVLNGFGGMVNGDPPGASLIPNPTPITNANMPHQLVTMFTNDIQGSTSIPINQSYVLTFNFDTTVINVPGSIVHILKFGNSNYGVKFTVINNSNKIFVTYVEKDDAYVGGYKDFTSTPLPSAWIDAARSFWGGSLSGINTKHYTASFRGTETAFSDEIGIAHFFFKYTNETTAVSAFPG